MVASSDHPAVERLKLLYDAQLETAQLVEEVMFETWAELIKIGTATQWWRFGLRWRRKWMIRCAWAFYMGAKDKNDEVKARWAKERPFDQR